MRERHAEDWTSEKTSFGSDNRLRSRNLVLFRNALVGLTTSSILLVLSWYLVLPLLVYYFPASESLLLDAAVYGAYPSRQYVSANFTSPRANVLQSDDACSSGLVLLSLDGQSVTDSGPTILDMAGNLVWSAPGQYGDASANTKIQRYNNQDYLTFWAGKKLQESGLGSYYMLDSSYRLAYVISAVGEGLQGDLHEFKMTAEGTALITVYERKHVDLGDTNFVHSADKDIVNALFQEIEVASGELLFEWRASQHLGHPALQTSSGGSVADGALDYFHINSVDKDSRGNFLVSMRHLHSVVCVNGDTGELLWTLGGVASDFEDLSMGRATAFRWQHDARWVSETEGIISLFDNGIAHKHRDAPYSQGMMIQLNFTDWTATLLQSYTAQTTIASPSQGDVQILEQPLHADHVFIGWGASAAFTEHALNGDLLCEIHFGASWLFYFERVKSYRAFKTLSWKGIPADWDPVARVNGDRAFVSWNGATEVMSWSLEAQHNLNNDKQQLSIRDQDFGEVRTITKGADFESSFLLPSMDDSIVYRIAALDAEGNVLRYSNNFVCEPATFRVWLLSAILFGMSLLGVLSFACRQRRWPRSLWREHVKNATDSEYHALVAWEPGPENTRECEDNT